MFLMWRDLPGVQRGSNINRRQHYCVLGSFGTQGVFAFRGAGGCAVLLSRLYGTAEAADLVGVSPATIRAWRRAPLDLDHPEGPRLLEPQGLDERGNPVHSGRAVRAAEKIVHDRGIERGGYDPRRLRNHTAA
jgi:hypothetical protein